MTAAPAGVRGPIAYLTGEYPKASHTFILREVEALRAQGVEVLTASIRRTGPEHRIGPEEEEAAASTFHVLEAAARPRVLLAAHAGALARAPRRWLAALALAWRTRPPGARAALRQLAYFAEAGVLADWIRRRGVRHLHNHFANSSCSVAMLAAELSGAPFSFTMHGPAIFFEPRWWRIDEKIARARFVACISHFCRSQGMIFADPAHWERLRVVHCGVHPARYDRPRRAAPEGELRLLFVGRLAAVKGVPVLFEALRRLRADHPRARLTLIGDGPEGAALRREAERLGIASAATFAGYRSQEAVAEAMAEADAFVLPSFAEGVPVVLMEAMASRLPVVASRVAGVPELVEDGVSGWLAPPGDAAALAERLARLAADPALRRRMGEAGRARVVAEHDAAREAAWLLALFGGAPGLRPAAPDAAEEAGPDRGRRVIEEPS